MTISATIADYWLDLSLGDGHNTTDFTANVAVGLSSTAPTATGTNITEPSGNGYAEVTVANTTANWANASGGSKSNAAIIAFPTATGPGWGTVGYFFVKDSSGNFMFGAALTGGPVNVAAGSTPTFEVGQLAITIPTA